MSAGTTVAVPTPAGGAATTGAGRVGNVDVLRAVAAYAVLAGHAYVLGGRPIPIRAEEWYDVPLRSLASGVFLFFAISGYVIGKPFIDRLLTGRPLPEIVPYLLRRAFRIFPLYWIAIVAFIAIVGTESATSWQLPMHFALLHNLVPGREAALLGVAWTLTIEVLFYLAVPLLALAIRRWRPAITAERLAGLVLASWLASIAAGAAADLHEPGRTGLWLRGSFIANWQMFCPGLLLAIAPHLPAGRWRRVMDRAASRPAVAAAVPILIGAALLATLTPRRWGDQVFQLLLDGAKPLFAIGFGIVLAAAIAARPWFQERARWILHMGLVSYGIYLLHAVLLAFLLDPLGDGLVPLPHGGVPAYVVHLAFMTAISVPLAMASWRWIERPLIDVSRTLGDRWRARPGVTRA